MALARKREPESFRDAPSALHLPEFARIRTATLTALAHPSWTRASFGA
jgi:hypothetical protein